MEKSIYTFILLSGIILGSSCSSNWLDTTPNNSVGAGTIFETTENAETAVYGLSRLMCTSYSYYVDGKLTSQEFNGEGTIKLIYGNEMGNHFFWANRDGYAPLFKGTNYMSNNTTIYDYYPWWYYYMVIGNANTIIENIGSAEGTEANRQFIQAQALTFRAYCYTMLAQLYCKRWSDSDNGNTEGVVLTLRTSNEGQEVCTLGQLYRQIYDDLDEAIRLYLASDKERTDNYVPDLRVAYATYARAALNRQDYATAASMAPLAREGHPLMNIDEYLSGFNAVNPEWIWSSCNTGSSCIYNFAYHVKMGYNTANSNYIPRPFCISRELYDKIPETDIRRSMFLHPGTLTYTTTTGKANAELSDYAKTNWPDASRATIYAYMQFKVKSSNEAGNGEGDLNHFRSSEMVLIEAEANYFLQREEEARALLMELVRHSGRDEAYECNKSGAALLEEIKLYRAIELWGEGFDWFDMKRWGDPIVRKTYAEGGSFTARTAFTTAPEENNGWTWIFPALETDYNEHFQLE